MGWACCAARPPRWLSFETGSILKDGRCSGSSDAPSRRRSQYRSRRAAESDGTPVDGIGARFDIDPARDCHPLLAMGTSGRWSRLALPTIAFAELIHQSRGWGATYDTYPIWFVLGLSGSGETSHRGTALTTPVAILGFAAPIAFGIPISAATAASLTIAVPVSVLIAEISSAAPPQSEQGRVRTPGGVGPTHPSEPHRRLDWNRQSSTRVLYWKTLPTAKRLYSWTSTIFSQSTTPMAIPGETWALQELGSFLVGRLSDRDDCARYGGEEFLAILRKDIEDYWADVYRLLQDWRDTRPLTTFSAGVAVKRRGETWSETLAAADSALYAAKEAGRDTAAFEGKKETELHGMAGRTSRPHPPR